MNKNVRDEQSFLTVLLLKALGRLQLRLILTQLTLAMVRLSNGRSVGRIQSKIPPLPNPPGIAQSSAVILLPAFRRIHAGGLVYLFSRTVSQQLPLLQGMKIELVFLRVLLTVDDIKSRLAILVLKLTTKKQLRIRKFRFSSRVAEVK